MRSVNLLYHGTIHQTFKIKQRSARRRHHTLLSQLSSELLRIPSTIPELLTIHHNPQPLLPTSLKKHHRIPQPIRLDKPLHLSPNQALSPPSPHKLKAKKKSNNQQQQTSQTHLLTQLIPMYLPHLHPPTFLGDLRLDFFPRRRLVKVQPTVRDVAGGADGGGGGRGSEFFVAVG